MNTLPAAPDRNAGMMTASDSGRSDQALATMAV